MSSSFLRSALVCFALCAPAVLAAEPEAASLSANELASRLSARQQDGTSYVRLRMEIKGPAKTALQVQIKTRASASATDIVYQILFPKDRKGESVLLRKRGNGAATGALYAP